MMKFDSKAMISIVLLVLVSLAAASAVKDPDEMKTVAHNLRGEMFHLPTNEEHTFGEDLPQQLDTSSHIQNVRELTVSGNIDIPIYNGLWGNWRGWSKVQSGGMYACGARIRFEDGQGGGDDTAANGLVLMYCGLDNWNTRIEKKVENGLWGGWKNWSMCPYGKYIGAARVRFEDGQGGGDDTALNGLELWCVTKDWRAGERKLVYGGLWGSWKSWGYKSGTLVKGARVRFENSQGGGDDTALNGIIFNVEPPNYGVSHAPITGTWKDVGSGPQGQLSHKIIESSQTTQSKQITNEETYGFTQSISAGFKIKVVDISAEVTASQSFSVSQTMQSSLTNFEGTETTIGCPSSGSSTGYYTMWQFIMYQEQDRNGVGFQSKTRHIRCTPSYSMPPRCVIGFCADAFCQQCKGGHGASYTKKYTRKWPHCDNVKCMSGSRSQMELECDKYNSCTGFSFSTGRTSGSGCLKKCGQNDSSNGYGINTHDYWMKQ